MNVYVYKFLQLKNFKLTSHDISVNRYFIMKKIIFILLCSVLLFSCGKSEEPIAFNYDSLIGTWVEYKQMDGVYVDTNKPYTFEKSDTRDTIAFTPSYQQLKYLKYNGVWFVDQYVTDIYPLGDKFTVNYYKSNYDTSEISQDGKNIIITSVETDYNRKFFKYFKKISKEWKLEYMLNDIEKK